MSSFVPSRNTNEFQEKLRRSVEQREIHKAICKEFIKKMYELENDLDVTLLEEENSSGEGVKRRRKSVTVDVDDILCISTEEAREDLQNILEEDSIEVIIEDDMLYIGDEIFVKGDKIRVIMNKEEFTGVISSISEEDVVFKTRDYKRLKVLLDDIRSTRSSMFKFKEDSY